MVEELAVDVTSDISRNRVRYLSIGKKFRTLDGLKHLVILKCRLKRSVVVANIREIMKNN